MNIYVYICNIPLRFSFSDGINAARIYRRIEKKKTMRVKSSKFIRVRIAANSVSTARSRSRDFSAPPSVGWRHRRLLSYMSRRRQSSARFSTSLYLVHRMCIYKQTRAMLSFSFAVSSLAQCVFCVSLIIRPSRITTSTEKRLGWLHVHPSLIFRHFFSMIFVHHLGKPASGFDQRSFSIFPLLSALLEQTNIILFFYPPINP